MMALPLAICVCPHCHGALDWSGHEPRCLTCEQSFPVIRGRPALIDFANSVIDRDHLVRSVGSDHIGRPGRLKNSVFQVMYGHDESAAYAAKEFLRRLKGVDGQRPRLLVIGGGTIGSGMDVLYASGEIDIIAFDIYDSPNVQLIADAHSLPFTTGSFDGVWIQAVLEHVLE